ncbi:hypothetical protein U14_02020 [Candidatus Moduliflexus flocculans]|uniref:DUF1232 domain-containing protein n=1 Tax=Candidatus Moduliflexus flocculans TaxID=1499966 RepID=A0A0S6VTB6_9BACT|nr:hypothetical protein U14_02020 [Candidatus Moduliflexus flocculans]
MNWMPNVFHRPSEKEVQESHAYHKASNKAESYLNDPEKLQGLLQQASTKAAHHKSGPLEALWEDLTTLLRMLQAYGARKYTAIPVATLLMLVTTVGYFVMPIDLIPDFILAAGFLDDATLIGLTIRSVQVELQKFREWEQVNS